MKRRFLILVTLQIALIALIAWIVLFQSLAIENDALTGIELLTGSNSSTVGRPSIETDLSPGNDLSRGGVNRHRSPEPNSAFNQVDNEVLHDLAAIKMSLLTSFASREKESATTRRTAKPSKSKPSRVSSTSDQPCIDEFIAGYTQRCLDAEAKASNWTAARTADDGKLRHRRTSSATETGNLVPTCPCFPPNLSEFNFTTANYIV